MAALPLDLFKSITGALDGVANHPSVEFDLGLARPASHANAATLAFQVRPAAHQARAHVLQPREFDLEFALVTAGPLGEDFKYQQGAVIDRQADVALQVALLGRTEGLIEEDFLGPMLFGEKLDFIRLAAADKQRRIGCLAFAGDSGNRRQSRRLCQQAQFFQARVKVGQPEIHADKHSERGGGVEFVSRTQRGAAAGARSMRQ